MKLLGTSLRRGVIEQKGYPSTSSLTSLYHDAFNSDKLFRIALYSHDAMGLGHIRRNILIANTISSLNINASILIISGTKEATKFKLSDDIDFLTLPSYHKNKDSRYTPKNLSIDINSLKNIRSSAIDATLSSFSPDLLIVDKLPRGILNELDNTLKKLKKSGKTKIVLGLRDILDTPEIIKSEWNENNYYKTINKYYDSIWVYGDPDIYDIDNKYELSKKINKNILYTGYLITKNICETYKDRRLTEKSFDLPGGKLIICLLGGGQDGIKLAEEFSKVQFIKGSYGLIITGPFMPNIYINRLYNISKLNPNLNIFNFVPDPIQLIKKAECVISMGGYNTICELLSLRKKALIIPRVNPRQEQLIRAERMSELGLIDMIRPEILSSEYLALWISKYSKDHKSKTKINMNGISNLSLLIKQMLGCHTEKMTGS